MNKKTMIIAIIVIVLVLVLVGGGLVSGLFTNGNKTQDTKMQQEELQEATIQQESQIQDQAQAQPQEIQVKDELVGTGDTAVAGKEVTVHYTGTFLDGKKFDSSLDKGTPFTFILGSGEVIKGWDIGVEGMKVGGKRTLLIPPQFGYGEADQGPIPGNSTLVFEVELLGVK